jgi:hypothetical protein
METHADNWSAEQYSRAAFTTLLLAYGIALLSHPGFALIDNVNLPIHETGHLVFAPFGEFVTALGGSLFQVIFPAVFVVYFIRRGDQHSASVALWWVAENLWNVAIYIADAQEQELPLVGGGEHDWAFLLAEMGILRRDDQVAAMVRVVGIMLFVLSIVWGYRAVSGRRRREDGLEAPSSA